MKKIIVFLTFILMSCSNSINEHISYDYNQIGHLKISWNDLFKPAKDRYFVYIYSISCFHCNEIKDVVIEYSLSEKYPTYFIEYNETIPIKGSISETYFAQNFEDVWILGTPTILEINKGFLLENISGKSNVINFLENN